MRLSSKKQGRVLEAALTHISDPAIRRIAGKVVVIGKDVDDSRRWAGLEVSRIDDDDGVWWCDAVYLQTRRKDVVAYFGGASDD
jgi:hypothetical protein